MSKSKPYLFQKGQSGNSKGRPKGSGLISRALKELMGETIRVRLKSNGRIRPEVSLTRAQNIARAITEMAQRGSVRAAEFIADRTEGKVKQVFEIESERDKMLAADPAQLIVEMHSLIDRLKRDAGK